MDWDSKLPPWDMTELEQSSMHPNPISTPSTIPIGPSVGPFETMAHSIGPTIDCSIDLKLGGSTDRRPVDLGMFHKDQSRGATSAPAKRTRGPTNQAQQPIVCCSVDGCVSDLSNCRDYHRRHKVCEAHSKTPIVLVGGQEQRFCQQCSRFHMLSEFDEVKRSCRKRLDGHNRRRRKPQSDTVKPPSFFSTNHQATSFSNLSSIFPTALPDPTWMGSDSNSHQYLTSVPPQPFSLTFPQNLKEQHTKRFPFLHEPTTTTETRNGIVNITPSVSRQFQKLIPISVSVSPESSGSSGGGGVNMNRMQYSECALSLLSSPPPTTTVSTSDLTVGPTCQPLFSGYRYTAVTGNSRLSMQEVHHGRSVFMPDSNSGNGISGIASGMENGRSGGIVAFDCQEMYNVVSHEEASIEQGSSQPLPFWHQ